MAVPGVGRIEHDDVDGLVGERQLAEIGPRLYALVTRSDPMRVKRVVSVLVQN